MSTHPAAHARPQATTTPPRISVSLTAAAALTALAAALCTACSPQVMPPWYTPKPFRPPPEPAVVGSGAPENAGPDAHVVPPVPLGPLDLSVVEASRLAFENNENIRVRRLDPAIAATDIQFERAAFDPVLSASANLTAHREQVPNNADPVVRSGSGTTTGSTTTGSTDATGVTSSTANSTSLLSRDPLHSTHTRRYEFMAGLTQLLPTGTKYGISGDWLITDSLSTRTDHFTQLGLNVVQPLLRGFGPSFNLTGIELAVRNTELTRYQFEQAVQDVIVGVEHAYWDLSLAKLNQAAQVELIDNTRKRLESTRTQVKLGKGTALDISQVEAALASRQEALLRFENQVEQARLQLLRLINPAGASDYWGLRIVNHVPQPDPDALPPAPDPVESTRTGWTNRPEMLQAQIGVAINEIQVRRAQNALLPQLDLIVNYGPNGHGDNLGRSLGSTFDFHGYNLEVGGQFSWALGNRAAGAQYDKAELSRVRAERIVDDTRKQVALDVRLALQQLDSSGKRYKASRISLAAQSETLQLATKLQREGGAGTGIFFLLTFEDNETNAKFLVNQAHIDYLRALSDLRRAEGTILKVRGLALNWP